jgi:hypothetical protein
MSDLEKCIDAQRECIINRPNSMSCTLEFSKCMSGMFSDTQKREGEGLTMSGAQVSSGESFKVSPMQKFFCDHSTITAPKIYLPHLSKCTIEDTCHLVGEIIHADEDATEHTL